MSRPKILFFSEIETPYRQAVFEKLCLQGDWDIRFVYLSQTQKGRHWKLSRSDTLEQKTSVLPGRQWASYGSHAVFINQGVQKFLKEQRPDICIVSGYAQPAFWGIRKFCLQNHLPYITVTESHLNKPRSSFWKKIKSWPIRRFYAKASSHLTMGSASKRYIQSFGAADPDIFFFPNTIDVPAFQRDIEVLREEPTKVRKNLGMGDGTIILYVGNMETWKGVEVLLEAFHAVRPKHPNASLHLVGAGSQETSLKRAYASTSTSIFFHGFQQPQELPAFYAAADLFVLPSRHETWGVVVIEAMAAALPAVVSDAVGCSPDLVEPGTTGLSFSPSSTQDLKDKLDWMLSNPSERSRMGAEARKKIQAWSIDRAVQGFKMAIDHTVQKETYGKN